MIQEDDRRVCSCRIDRNGMFRSCPQTPDWVKSPVAHDTHVVIAARRIGRKDEMVPSDDEISELEDDAKLIERLADWDHRAWAKWTDYLLNNRSEENEARWRRQIVTPYSALSEKEKDSDRKEAREILGVIRAKEPKPVGQKKLTLGDLYTIPPTEKESREANKANSHVYHIGYFTGYHRAKEIVIAEAAAPKSVPEIDVEFEFATIFHSGSFAGDYPYTSAGFVAACKMLEKRGAITIKPTQSEEESEAAQCRAAFLEMCDGHDREADYGVWCEAWKARARLGKSKRE